MLNSLLPWFLGGPATALVRYGVSAAGVWLLAKGVPENIVEQAGALVLTAVPPLLGMLAATTKERARAIVDSSKIDAVVVKGIEARTPEAVKSAFDWASRG